MKDMRNPSSELLREQALKIAEYKSPGMWVLLERYQKHADELRAEAEKAALPDEAVAAASADATLEPEAPPAVRALQICKAMVFGPLAMQLLCLLLCQMGSVCSLTPLTSHAQSEF